MKQSSFGNAAPKNRSIDVGANLLGEWISEQDKLKKEIVRLGTVLGGTVLATAVVLPLLWRTGSEAAAQTAKLKLSSKQLDAQLVVSDKARKDAQPTLVVSEMNARTRASFGFFLNEIESVLRAGNARMALSSLRCDVTAAEAHLVVQAFAEDEAAIDAFAHSASEQGAKVDTVTNSRPSVLLGPGGLSFEYVRRMEVTK